MSDNQQDIPAEVPLTGVTASPNVISDLMEADEQLARDLIYLVSGLEHYRNFRHKSPKQFDLGMEDGNSDTLSRVIDYLIRFIKQMIHDINEGSMGISLTLNKVINRAEMINTTSRAARRTNKEGKFKIETRIQNLSLNFKPINDPQRLLMYLKSSDIVVRRFFKYQEEELMKVIPSIITLDPSAPQHLDQLINILRNVSPASFAKAAGFTDNTHLLVGPHLLGNQQLLVTNKNANSDVLDQLCGQEFILQLSDDEPKTPPEYIEYDVFAKTIEQNLLRQVIGTATDLASRIGVMARMRRTSRVTSLVNYLEVIRRNIAEGKYEGDALQNANAFINLIEAFDNWLVNPYLSLLALMTRNMSAVLNVCDANN